MDLLKFFQDRVDNFKPDMFVWIIILCLMPLTFLLGTVVLDKKKYASRKEKIEEKFEFAKFYSGATTLAFFTIAVYCAAVFLFGYRPAVGPYPLPNTPFFIIGGVTLGLGLISLVGQFVIEGIHKNLLNDPSYVNMR